MNLTNPETILFQLICLLIAGCSANPRGSNGVQTPPKSEIQQFAELIPSIDLPMAFVCEEGFPIADVDLPDSLLARYVPESASTIMGTLYNNEKGVGIVTK